MPWGRIAPVQNVAAAPAFRDALNELVVRAPHGSILATGLGRSYGDVNINTPGKLIDMSGLDRVIAFDRVRGRLRAEAGMALGSILQVIVPTGWFLPTTPGTRFVTLGGAVANDVHGKNHHRMGSFGSSVAALGLLRSDGTLLELRRDDGSELFRATIGGMGLTGVIVWVEIDLVAIASSDLTLERVPFQNLNEYFRLSAELAEAFEHTVSWFDCASSGKGLGRGIFQRANWCTEGPLQTHTEKVRLTMAVDAPGFALNALTVRAFNTLYYGGQKLQARTVRAHYSGVFYPLNSIAHWNRLYGRRGFYQYQCVIPPGNAEAAIGDLLRVISRAGAGSFLAVLKSLGPAASIGMVGFPQEGTTLALDFPNSGLRTLELMARLDGILRQAGGRLYAAKDGRMTAEMYAAGDPGMDVFKKSIDPAFSSDFWRRVSL